MAVLFENDIINVRQLRDCSDDYNLFVKWLSDLDVCEYYEGRTKPYNYAMVLEKFEERAKGIDPVEVGIIEHKGIAIGFLQFYTSEQDEYHLCDDIEMCKYSLTYSMDIVIGDKNYWNKGLGTQAMLLLTDYLFTEKNADILYIAPQTWNTRAVRTYEKAGFKQVKIIKEMELHDDEYRDGVLMVKTR